MTPVPHTVLVVEDETDATAHLGDTLEACGLAVWRSPHPQEALYWLRREAVLPALIVVDWSASLTDGLALLHFQAADPRHWAVPVVVVADLARLDKVPDLCVSVVLARPVRPRTLIRVAERLCGLAPLPVTPPARSSRPARPRRDDAATRLATPAALARAAR